MADREKDVDREKEREWIARAKRGDEASFEALLSSCKEKAYNVAYRYLRNEDDAMDALQESFIKIYRHLNQFNEQSRFDTWVYRIVVNTCSDMLRRTKNKALREALYKHEEQRDAIAAIPDAGAGPGEVLEQKEESAYIISCLEKVGSDHKEILILRDIQGFSYEEIAKIQDCSLGTVKSRLSRARNRLKEVYLTGGKTEQSETMRV